MPESRAVFPFKDKTLLNSLTVRTFAPMTNSDKKNQHLHDNIRMELMIRIGHAFQEMKDKYPDISFIVE